ncbi:MAG: P-II family nitrogen regulator [Oscillospiraceae bacterium]|nr:P-II family nitrogen regulator [Oscillospiraceae bacterium]
MARYSLICCVVNMNDASRLLRHAEKYGITRGTISIGRGTVNSRLLEFLALNEVRKEVVTMVAESKTASAALKGISEYMEFEKPHHGIAFSHAISEVLYSGSEPGNTSENAVEGKSMYNIIYVVVEKGKAEDVIDAANRVGSRGGTIINARGAGSHEVERFFSMEIEPEREEVFIITKNDLKDAIVESIRERLKIDEPHNGILFVLDVDEVYGLH